MSREFLPPFLESPSTGPSPSRARIVVIDDDGSATPVSRPAETERTEGSRRRRDRERRFDPRRERDRRENRRRDRNRKDGRPGLIDSFTDHIWTIIKRRASKRLVIILANIVAIVFCWFLGGDLQPTDVALILTNVAATIGGFSWRDSYQGMNSTRLRLSIGNTLAVVLNSLLPFPMSPEMITAISGVVVSIIVSDSIEPTKRDHKAIFHREKQLQETEANHESA